MQEEYKLKKFKDFQQKINFKIKFKGTTFEKKLIHHYSTNISDINAFNEVF